MGLLCVVWNLGGSYEVMEGCHFGLWHPFLTQIFPLGKKIHCFYFIIVIVVEALPLEDCFEDLSDY